MSLEYVIRFKAQCRFVVLQCLRCWLERNEEEEKEQYRQQQKQEEQEQDEEENSMQWRLKAALGEVSAVGIRSTETCFYSKLQVRVHNYFFIYVQKSTYKSKKMAVWVAIIPAVCISE